MINTIYKCDCCGKEWNKNEKGDQLCTVTLTVNFGNISPKHPTGYSPKESQHWCKTCVMKKGIHEPYCPEDKKIVPKIELSFEDRVVILLNEIGFYQGD